MTKKIFSIFILLLSCFMIASCSSFFGEEEEEIITITSINSELLDDGSTKITITYSSEEKKPDEFIIEQGADGNGIASINATTSADGSKTDVFIYFTDATIEPVHFEVSNGTSIAGVSRKVDEETGDVYLIMTYTDGKTSDPILLPKGEDGEDGNSFTGYDQVVNLDKSLTIYFHFSKSDDVVITIPAPQQGEDGNGIDSITSMTDEETNEYVLLIKYSNKEEPEEVRFKMPKEANTWYTSQGEPDDLLGKNGDYCFDVAYNAIYLKENNEWGIVVDMDGDETIFNVSFNLNDSIDAPAKMPSGSLVTYHIKRGSYFTADGYPVPVPTRNGYEFAGWYTSKIVTPVNGQFTDLTPVFSDLVLYAKWEPIA